MKSHIFCMVILCALVIGTTVVRADAAEAAAGVDSIRISQIDASSLLINQGVRVYLSATDAGGNPVTDLGKESFTLTETAGRGPERPREILSFNQGINANEGINLLLILDNSGSMYWDGSGRVKNSSDPMDWRVTYAKDAILSLLNEIKNPLDKVGLLTFNVKIQKVIRPSDDKGRIGTALEQTVKPSEEEAYTELYETVYNGVSYIRGFKGRRVIVVLSDGQNFPMKNNPAFTKRRGIEGAIEAAQREGISVFTIGLSTKADRTNLSKIARETGGAYFTVYDPQELKGLYSLIRNQILNEYLVTYAAAMDPAEKKLVRVRAGDGERLETERLYFSATLFGIPVKELRYPLFLFAPAALVLLFLLSRVRFIYRKAAPTLSVLTVAGKKVRARGRTIALGAGKTQVTIGGSDADDLTISGDPKVRLTEVAVERKGGVYTLKAEKSPVTVNNRAVKTRVLKSGDVIRVGDTTVVFDEGRVGDAGK